MKKTIYGIAAVVALATGLACSGTGPTATGDGSRPTVTAAAPAPSALTSFAPPPPAASPKPVAPTIEDGVWTVGDDIPAGTYKVSEPLTSMCYWGIYKSGTNQADIIDNDIVDGGKPTVTLKKGQDFKSSNCGTWVKIK